MGLLLAPLLATLLATLLAIPMASRAPCPSRCKPIPGEERRHGREAAHMTVQHDG